ncbi:NAD(P)-binding protein [Tilletiopsis washingtonensis]|uniref:NAD(P)-binding protein n=1 Tax=Tilletiopsis washingtonensis TaxID=58919 RepID=A0A316ZE98_9BASI|nr:NAD(P)-binding protein [Tilletiopsis washingtonensis]PWN99859.1 NAD(P)-binding protein [Tilletiopsis washingtonensis]
MPLDFDALAGVPPYPPAGKAAIVTGGSSGIGRSTALALHRAGWSVCITARRAEALEETLRLMRAQPGSADGSAQALKATSFAGDITSEETVLALFKHAYEQLGQIDLVFCNAGVSTAAVPLFDLPLADWNKAVSTNLTATFLCAREAFRYMSPERGGKGGRIIVNGSISAAVPRPHSAPYTASKHGCTGLTKSLALDGRAHNIAVSQIDIGNASSDMTERMRTGPGVMQADGSLRQEPVMDREHAAREVVHIAEMPLSVNVQFVTIQATKMPSMIGRG